MSGAILKRCAYKPYLDKLCPVEDTVKFFKNGMYVGWSGFTPSGDPKVVPVALAEYVEKNKLQGKLRFHLLMGGSSSEATENRWAKNNMIATRYPYQNGTHNRNNCNNGKTNFADMHVSRFPTDSSWGFLTPNGKLDIAIIEATEILPDGSIILGSGVGSATEWAQMADKVIIELNTAIPSFKGCHDITMPWKPPGKPFPIMKVSDRIGQISVPIDPSKVIAVVESNKVLPGRTVASPDAKSKMIAGHIIDFFDNEVKEGRLPENLYPLQSGVGNIANAVVAGLNDSKYGDLSVFTEVVQDGLLAMFDSGKLKHASATALTLQTYDKFFEKFDFYKPKFVLRTQGISNSPEVIRRLGVIAMNTPLEIDIYAHANSTHTNGSRIVNGIGGSGDFLRNGYLSIMHTISARATKTDPTGISSILPFASHVDHTEHDLDVIVTEQGLADVRGLCPVERANLIIDKCVHPSYKDQLREYLNLSIAETQPKAAGHEPHILTKAFKMHTNLRENGTMHIDSW